MTTSTATVTMEPTVASNRRQPLRQARTNPSRTATRALGDRPAPGERSNEGNQLQHGFVPAITHFTDSIAALPKEMIRHNTMLKEVDAKIYGPEQIVKELVSVALRTPIPPKSQPHTTLPRSEGGPQTDHGSFPVAPNNSVVGHAGPSTANVPPQVGSDWQQYLQNPAYNAYRHNMDHLRRTMKEMLTTLDEKNHVLSTANDTLKHQLERCETSYPYINDEISEEARLGNLHHWAYVEKSVEKKGPAPGERPTRNTGGAGPSHDAEPVAPRSDLRREAATRKRHHNDSDFDDGRTAAQGSSKKAMATGKGKKVAEQPAPSSAQPAGLGITNGTPPTTTTTNKRRKTEKTNGTTSSALALPAMSSVYGPTASMPNGKRATSRERPAIEVAKKRARAGTGAEGASRKRAGTNASANNTPSIASSPVVGTFSTSLRNGPSYSPLLGGAPMQRSLSSRMRNNSNSSNAQPAESSRANRASSSAAASKPPAITAAAAAAATNGSSALKTETTVPTGTRARKPSTSLAQVSPSPTTMPAQTNGNASSSSSSSSSSNGPAAAASSAPSAIKNPSSTTPSNPTLPPPKRSTSPDPSPTTIPTQLPTPLPTSRPRASRPPSISTSTRNGASRTSKTATPVSGVFPTPVETRPRSARHTSSSRVTDDGNITGATANGGGGGGGGATPTTNAGGGPSGLPSSTTSTAFPPPPPIKRSHKKGAGLAAQMKAQQVQAQRAASGGLLSPNGTNNLALDANGGTSASEAGEATNGYAGGAGSGADGEDDRYCYCDGPSYGEMVACDNPLGCAREWFHLECVGLKGAPGKLAAKWYCRDCKESMRKGA